MKLNLNAVKVENSTLIGNFENVEGAIQIANGIYLACLKKPTTLNLFFLRILLGFRWVENSELFKPCKTYLKRIV